MAREELSAWKLLIPCHERLLSRKCFARQIGNSKFKIWKIFIQSGYQSNIEENMESRSDNEKTAPEINRKSLFIKKRKETILS
jgi:hypothetical protein